MTDQQQSIFATALQEMNLAGIRYALLRDEDVFSPDLSELDLLVWPQDRRKYVQLMRKLGFIEKRGKIPGKSVLMHWDGKRLKLLDTHYAFIQNGIQYLGLDGVDRRLGENRFGYSTLSREDRLVHLFFHNLLGKGHLQEKHLPVVEKILHDSPDKEYMRSRINDQKVRDIFAHFMDHPEVFTTDKKMAAAASGTISKQLLRSSLSNRLNHFSKKHLDSISRRQSGVQIAFMGVDGAGKTTTIDEVRRHLDCAGKIKYEMVYMGPWGRIQSPVLKIAYKLGLFPPKEDWFAILKSKLAGQKGPALPTIIKKLVAGKIKGWLYYSTVYIELWYRYLRMVKPRLKKHRIVLSDRYIYDLRHIYKKRPMNDFRFSRYFICKFFPKPALIVYLHNDPDAIVKRKPQLNADEIRMFHKFYTRALNDYPVLSIQTNRPPRELAEEIVDRIMQKYLGKV